MITLSRTMWSPVLFAPEGEDGGQPDGQQDQGQQQQDQGAAAFDPAKAYAELDTESRTWLQKHEALFQDPKALAKHAFNQEKLIGSSIRVPGENATDEEKNAFLDKLGRPKTADDYKLVPPKDLPKELPYDTEFAKRASAKAHELGLTQTQLAGLHDLFVGYQVELFGNQSKQHVEQLAGRAKAATAEIEKLWGPLTGERAQQNLEIADKVFTESKGGADFLAALKDLGLVGPNKEIFDARIVTFINSLGTALYTEDGVLRGRTDEVGNPFAEGPGFNLTKAMKVAKEDPDRARSLITAAGKKLSDFGLK